MLDVKKSSAVQEVAEESEYESESEEDDPRYKLQRPKSGRIDLFLFGHTSAVEAWSLDETSLRVEGFELRSVSHSRP